MLIQLGHEQARGKGVLFHGFSPFLTAVVGSCRFFQYTTSQKGEKAQTKTVMIGRRGKFRRAVKPPIRKKAMSDNRFSRCRAWKKMTFRAEIVPCANVYFRV
jgi:hypothetical protein